MLFIGECGTEALNMGQDNRKMSPITIVRSNALAVTLSNCVGALENLFFSKFQKSFTFESHGWNHSFLRFGLNGFSSNAFTADSMGQ